LTPYNSQSALEKLSEEALAEYRAGQTHLLDADFSTVEKADMPVNQPSQKL